ncbi:MAG: Ig-like domain-containing protein [Bacteroidia bacterium]|nr:Ig-like domain-containing protein [Bacteroidia bacterium]
MKFKRIYQLALLLQFIQSCAQIVTPNGGNVDSKAPAIKFANPPQNATNVSVNKFKLTFNEYININDASAQLIISPPLNSTPELVLKNKTLVIKIKDTLASNTTYTFNFGNSISDITENNKFEDFKYTFATGAFLDSLKLTGVVYNAFTQIAEKGVLVMLYANATDSAPMKRKPNYFAKTNENGQYTISNVKQGTYSLFALKDANNDLMYNQTTENIGFNNLLIDIQKDTMLNVLLFNEGNEKQYVKRNNSEAGTIKLIMNRASKNINISRADGKQVYTYMRNNPTNDSLELWHASITNDTTQLLITTDTKTDTLQIIYKIPNTAKKQIAKGRGQSGLILTPSFSNGTLDYGKKLVFNTNNPIKQWDSTKISLYYINDTLKKDTLYVKLAITKANNFTLIYNNELPSNKTMHLHILPNAITDCIGNTNDTLNYVFKINTAENYGNFKLTIVPKNVATHYILALNNKEGKTIERKLLNTKNMSKGEYVVPFANLPAGDYTLQLTYDTNADGRWTTGNYLQKKQPETIIQYSGKLTLRGNWDTEQTWKLDK